MKLSEKIETALASIRNIEGISTLISKIENLGYVVSRLTNVEKSLSGSDALESLAMRIEKLDLILKRIESPIKTIDIKEPVSVNPVKQDLLEWNRLKLLSKFVALSEKGEEIEKEWQRIQQDEHDFQFAFETSLNEESQAKYLYKKGIADGVKWCLKNFS